MANIKTIALSGAETAVYISGQNCDIRNDSTDIVYASAMPGVTAGADGVLSIPAGGAAKLLDCNGAVYLLGTGNVQLCGNDYSEQVFKVAATSSGGGGTEDTVAREAINAHAGNTSIHLTEYKLDEAVAEVKTYADRGDSAALTTAKSYADTQSAAALEAAKAYSAPHNHSHTVSDITDFPSALPASDVQSWAKAATKPSYTANEVGADTVGAAAAALTTAKSYADTQSAAALEAAKAYSAPHNHSHTVSDITDFPSALPASDVQAWAKAATKPSYTANEVGADTVGAAAAALTSAKAYADGKLLTGSEAASLENCPEGCWYGQYE